MSVMRKSLLSLAVAALLWLSAAPAADASHVRWYGAGWGWGGARWYGGHVGWGGVRWHGYYGGWGYRPYYGPRVGVSIGLGYPWGWNYGYSPYYYSPLYYTPSYYNVWPSVSYSYVAPPVVYSAPPVVYSAPPVVVDARQPVVVDPNPSLAPVQPAGSRSPELLPAPTPESRSARVEVVVPEANAEVWFGSYRTKAKGLKRVFETPALPAGKNYSYPVIVQWTENGVTRQETRRVAVQPGATVMAVFNQSGEQPPPIPAGEKQAPINITGNRR